MSKNKFLRMCVACRKHAPKSELLRMVRAEDSVVIDRQCTTQARGAYLCPERACIERARKTGALKRHLKCARDEEALAQAKEIVNLRG